MKIIYLNINIIVLIIISFVSNPSFAKSHKIPPAAELHSIKIFSHGLEKPTPMRPNLSTKKFIPFSKAINHTKENMILMKIQDTSAKGYSQSRNGRYVGLGPFTVKPFMKYVLTGYAATKYHMRLQFYATFTNNSGKRITPFLPIGTITSTRWHTFTTPFITPSKVSKMMLWVYMDAPGDRPLRHGIIALFNNWRIKALGTIDNLNNTNITYRENLLAISNFHKFPVGAVNYKALKLTNRHTQKKKPYQAKIFKTTNSKKVLKVHWHKGLYPYVFFKSKPAPFYGRSAQFTVRIRGHGKIKLGIWWKRKYLSYFYQHGPTIKLTDHWQTITISSGCAQPLTQYAACSITCRGDKTHFELSELDLILQKPVSSDKK